MAGAPGAKPAAPKPAPAKPAAAPPKPAAKPAGGKKELPTKVTKFSIEGGKLVRTGRACPRCGAGVFMADHKDRFHCGRCGLTEFKAGVERIRAKPSPKPVVALKKEEKPKPVEEAPVTPAGKGAPARGGVPTKGGVPAKGAPVPAAPGKGGVPGKGAAAAPAGKGAPAPAGKGAAPGKEEKGKKGK